VRFTCVVRGKRCNALSKQSTARSSTKVIYVPADLSGIKVATRAKLLWPCHAYKIALPVARKRPLNIFQETVLRLTQANIRNPKDIAALCCLDEELVGFILSSLAQHGLISHRGELTLNGESLLKGSYGESTEESAAVFVDLIGGNLLPTIWPGRLTFAQVTDVSEDEVQFLDGSSGRKQKQKARLLERNDLYLVKRPTPSEIDEIVRVQARHQRRNAMANSGAISVMQGIPGRLDGISIAPDPEFLFLCLETVIQQGQFDPMISNPFGYGFSQQLRKAYRAYETENPSEKAWQKTFLKGAVVHGLEEKVEPESLPAIPYQPVLRHIEQAQKQCRQTRTVGRSSEAEQHQRRSAAACWSALYAATEQALRYVVQQHRPQSGLETLLVSGTYLENGGILLKIAEKLGFHVTERAMALLQVAGGKIDREQKGQQNELQPLLALALAGANDEREHPLCRLSKVDVEWLDFIRQLKLGADASNHGALMAVETSGEVLAAHTERAIQAISVLLPEFSIHTNVTAVAISSESEISNRRLQARIAVVERLDGYEFDELPQEIRENLISLALTIAELPSIPDVTVDATAAIVTMTSLLQLALQELVKTFPIISKVEPGARGMLVGKAVQAGFVLVEGAFPISISRVKQKRFEKAARDLDQTVGAALLALLLRADPVRLGSVAARIPNLIKFTGELSDLRGHGNAEVRISREMLNDLASSIFETVQTIMELCDDKK
jgi:hypothetical protein